VVLPESAFEEGAIDDLEAVLEQNGVTMLIAGVRQSAPQVSGKLSRETAASFFGMPLGLIGLGIAWQVAAQIWRAPREIGIALVWLGSLVLALLFLLYIGKWIWHRAAAEAEFEHPVQCCFVGLGGMVGSLASAGLAPQSRGLAVALFFIGATWTLVFALYRTGKLWMGDRSPEATTPILYLPTVAGSLVTASAAAALGHADWGQLAFGAGVFGWFAIESVLVHCCRYTSPAVAAGAYLNVCLGSSSREIWSSPRLR
jgi:tellurite resistance protein